MDGYPKFTSTITKVQRPGRKKPIVIKRVPASERVNTEIDILSALDHPCIPKLLDRYTTDCMTCISMECKPGLTLEQASAERNFTEADARYVMKQLVHITNYLHNTKRVVHRNINPENVIVDEFNNVSLIDFSLADFITDNMTERIGTPAFCSPEMVCGKLYNEKIDVWGLGIIAYFLMSETLPFTGNSVNEVFESIYSYNPIIEKNFRRPVSSNFMDFIRQTLSKDMEERASTAELINHPWICHGLEPQQIMRAHSGGTSSAVARCLFGAKPRRVSLIPQHSAFTFSMS